jgi:PLD-like domain
MKILKRFEYGCIGASVLGAILAIAKQQLAFFVIPATSSLVMNLTNRQKELARLEQSLAHYGQSTSKEINAVQTSLNRLSAAPDLEVLRIDLNKNRQDIEAVKTDLVGVVQKSDKIFFASKELVVLGDFINQLNSEIEFLKESIFNVNADNKSQITDVISEQKKISLLMNDVKLKIGVAMKNTSEVPDLYRRIDDLNSTITSLHNSSSKTNEQANKDIDKLVQEVICEKFEIIKKGLPKGYTYDLVWNRTQSRSVLFNTLKQAKRSMLLICPWISDSVLASKNKESISIKELIVSAVQKNVSVSLGWGYLEDIKDEKLLSDLKKGTRHLTRDMILDAVPKDQKWKYSGIDFFDRLQKEYPDLVKIKVLGTHEKIWVCDNRLAMIGSHNFMISTDKSQERELGIKTTDPQIISDIVASFNQAGMEAKKTLQNTNRVIDRAKSPF